MHLPGWQKVLLYPAPLEPAFAYISPSALAGKPTVFIDAGIHGNEPAPIFAAHQSENILQSLAINHGIIIIPIANPLGYKNNTRYIDANPDWEANPHSVGDMGHLLGWYDHSVWKEPSNNPDNPYCEHLSKFIKSISSKTNIKLILDLHEDNHPVLQPGSYIYPIGNNSPAQPLLDLISSTGIPLLSNEFTRFGETITSGVVTQIPNASLPEYVQFLNPHAMAYTIESTTNLPLSDRINLHTQIITKAIVYTLPMKNASHQVDKDGPNLGPEDVKNKPKSQSQLKKSNRKINSES